MAPDRRAEDPVGPDAAPDQLLEHAHLHGAAAAAAGQHEGRAAGGARRAVASTGRLTPLAPSGRGRRSVQVADGAPSVVGDVAHGAARGRRGSPVLWPPGADATPSVRPVVAHRPHDHDHDERDHRHDEDPEDHEEGGVPWPDASGTRASAIAPLRVERGRGVTPRGHTACDGPRRPTPTAPIRPPRGLRRRTSAPGRGPGLAAGGRLGPAALRPRAGRRTAGVARGRRLRRGRRPGRARPPAVPRAAPAARLARRSGPTATNLTDGRGPVAPRARAVPPARAHRRDRRPAGRRARGAARREGGAVVRHVESLPAPVRAALSETVAAHAPEPHWARCPGSRRAGCRGPTTGSPSRSPAVGWCCTVSSTCSSVSRNRARRRCARSACPPGGPWASAAAVAALSGPARDAAQRHSPVPAGPAGIGHGPLRRRGRARGAPAGHRLPHRCVARPRHAAPMGDRLTAELVAPVPDVDIGSWHAALAGGEVAAGRPGRAAGRDGPFRVTDHEVRTALRCDAGGPSDEPFAWSAARRGAPSAWRPCGCSSPAAPARPLDAVRGAAGRIVPLGARRELVRLAARPLARPDSLGGPGGRRRQPRR